MSQTHAAVSAPHRGHGLFSLPSTRPGLEAVWLFATFATLAVIAMTLGVPGAIAQYQAAVMPFYSVAMLACGLAAGIVGLLAIVRRQERSWLVWASALVGLDIMFLLFGELLGQH